MRFADIPVGQESPRIVNSIVEIPRGSSNKYEYNSALDAFVLDRVLFSPLYYPTEYGWVAGTLSEDGDPLDILIFATQPTFPGCVIRSRPIGLLHMHDDGTEDQKIIAVAASDPRYAEVNNLGDLPGHYLREISHFFRVYKQLEMKDTEILGWKDITEAHRVIGAAVDRENQSRSYQH